MAKKTEIIGYDAKRIVRNATGLGNYCRNTVRCIADCAPDGMNLRLYAPDKGRDELRLQIPESGRCRYVYPQACRSSLAKSIWRTHGIVADLKCDRVDLFHGLSGELPIGLRKSGIRSVVTIHDLIFMRHPEYYHAIDALLYRWKFHATCREADRIIAISECTKRDIVELGKVDPGKITVVYQSCNPRYTDRVTKEQTEETRRRLNLPRRIVLSVGTIEERKNTLLAVEALQWLPSDINLVLVGKETPYAHKIRQAAQRKGLSNRVLLLHGVGDTDLQAIYQMADVFVYPSRYEGFGIPIIEAIHSHLPVAACTGSCLEEAGGPGCIYTAPDNAERFANAIGTLLNEPVEMRLNRIAESLQYVKKFEGRNVASEIIDIYNNLL